jgi:hypothetical protein
MRHDAENGASCFNFFLIHSTYCSSVIQVMTVCAADLEPGIAYLYIGVIYLFLCIISVLSCV